MSDNPDDDLLSRATIAIDCRWLGMGGPGRVTELILAELRRVPPGGTWLLWGDPSQLQPYTFPGSSVTPWRGRPDRWFGQSGFLSIPHADLTVYPHQLRPLRPGPAVNFIHDTIPLRHDARPVARVAKSVYFRLVSRLATQVVTVSDWSRSSIQRDLGMSGDRIHVAALGVDEHRLATLRERRSQVPRAETVLFIGRFAEHKNLRRLSRAFQATALHARGGELLLVGGTSRESASLGAWLGAEGLSRVRIRERCSDDELTELLAATRAVVQVSVEEGYGLPAVEAAAAGVPVVVSRTGVATTIPAEIATFVDPLDVAAIAAGIDAALARPDPVQLWTPASNVGRVTLEAIGQVLEANLDR